VSVAWGAASRSPPAPTCMAAPRTRPAPSCAQKRWEPQSPR
jgi:hypothetical protein